ncbi:MAG: 3'(2'),5'-bisphosphate nucleotidase CysQ [bacterium]|nr:3'(2'),5'-bisphosphate nucleotidase CysQ [bacterium]
MLENIITIAHLAGKTILKWYEKAEVPTKIKADCSPLTLADEDANKVILEGLSGLSYYPIISEEALVEHDVRKYWDTFWLVDPLDGTKNFIAKDGQFTVNIALIKRDRPILSVIYAPVLNLCYSAELGKGAFLNGNKIQVNNDRKELIAAMSGFHSSDQTAKILKEMGVNTIKSWGSSLKLCKIAEGEIDIYPRLGDTCEWDIAAGHLILTEAGGSIRDLKTKKEPLYNKLSLLNNNFVATRGNLDISKFYEI